MRINSIQASDTHHSSLNNQQKIPFAQNYSKFISYDDFFTHVRNSEEIRLFEIDDYDLRPGTRILWNKLRKLGKDDSLIKVEIDSANDGKVKVMIGLEDGVKIPPSHKAINKEHPKKDFEAEITQSGYFNPSEFLEKINAHIDAIKRAFAE